MIAFNHVIAAAATLRVNRKVCLGGPSAVIEWLYNSELAVSSWMSREHPEQISQRRSSDEHFICIEKLMRTASDLQDPH